MSTHSCPSSPCPICARQYVELNKKEFVKELLAQSDQHHQDLRQHYLGVLGLLANCAVHISNYGAGDEMRDLIEDALRDAQKLIPELKWRRVLKAFEITVGT